MAGGQSGWLGSGRFRLRLDEDWFSMERLAVPAGHRHRGEIAAVGFQPPFVFRPSAPEVAKKQMAHSRMGMRIRIVRNFSDDMFIGIDSLNHAPRFEAV